MISGRRIRLIGIVVAVAFTLVAAALLPGCAKKGDTAVKSGPTALGSLSLARAELSTIAPDAKLLVVQTAQAVAPTATPDWGYLFGSPSSDKTYVVYFGSGKSQGVAEYGTAGLSKSEWSLVPGTGEWKIDSDEAYKRALAASGAKGAPAAYVMGFATYKPEADTSTAEAFVWTVQFDPGASGATTSAIDVNVKTGATKVAK